MRRPFLLGAIALVFVCLALPTEAVAQVSVAAIGSSQHNQAADQIFSSGDLLGTITRISDTLLCNMDCESTDTFNSLTPANLRADFDVLIITWDSDPDLNLDWNTRIVPYLELGGGVIFEDPNNVGDLLAGVTTIEFESVDSSSVIATVPGLTDGIVDSFVNNHIGFLAWDPALSPFLSLFEPESETDVTTGLFGEISTETGCGRIVLTGPDQDFHGFRGGGDPSEPGPAPGNQYNLLLNEVTWVAEGCGTITEEVPEGPNVEVFFDYTDENHSLFLKFDQSNGFDLTVIAQQVGCDPPPVDPVEIPGAKGIAYAFGTCVNYRIEDPPSTNPDFSGEYEIKIAWAAPPGPELPPGARLIRNGTDDITTDVGFGGDADDPFVRGRGNGFSDFIAVNVPSDNSVEFRQPVTNSSFKAGSTIPVKVRILGPDGKPITDVIPQLTVQRVSDDAISEVRPSGRSNQGNLFRRAGKQFTYEWKTDKELSGRYLLIVSANGDSPVLFEAGSKEIRIR